jgi:hypothetical protein
VPIKCGGFKIRPQNEKGILKLLSTKLCRLPTLHPVLKQIRSVSAKQTKLFLNKNLQAVTSTLNYTNNKHK